MRRFRRSLLAGVILTLTSAIPALAGGGAGGECYQEEPRFQEGWVAVLDNCFSPVGTSIQTGDTVRWRSEAFSPHTVTFADGPDLQLGITTDEIAVRFNRAGDYAYLCTFHPGMNGAITVDGATTGGAPLEVIDTVTGEVTETGGELQPAGGLERRTLLVELDPLAAAVVVLLFFPLTAGAAFRVLGMRGRPKRTSKIKLQLPWRHEPVPSSGTRR